MKIPHYNSVLPACLGKNLGRESGTAQERNLNKNQLSENFGYLMICLILFQTNEPLAILELMMKQKNLNFWQQFTWNWKHFLKISLSFYNFLCFSLTWWLYFEFGHVIGKEISKYWLYIRVSYFLAKIFTLFWVHSSLFI